MRKVLLVNDSRFESIILKDILNTIGYDVRIADEYNAVKQMQSYEPDIVIANLLMKEIRGDQLVSIIKVQNSKVKCILCSNNPIRMEDFHFKKIDGVFRTPIDKPGLEKVLKEVKNSFEADEAVVVREAAMKPEEKQASPASEEKKQSWSARAVSGETTGTQPPADTIRFCRQCGHRLGTDGFVFCPYCGGKI